MYSTVRLLPGPQPQGWHWTTRLPRTFSPPPQWPCVILLCAGLQQGTAAWHRARSCHITGSQLSDLLGFSCPKPNRALLKQQVYHRVPGQHAGGGPHVLRVCVWVGGHV
jgi:hypothetical protein